MEVWRNLTSSTRHAIRFAEESEADGFDGIGVTDSQNLAGDCWVALTAMSSVTTTLKLGTGVTNPVTRHPATTAAAAHALNILSPAPDGSSRVVLGIGRGASALAHVEVAASGPRVIGTAAIHADRVLLAIGADLNRLEWGMQVARDARKDAGLDPMDIAFGAYVQVVPHDDVDKAMFMSEGSLTTFARFSVMHGTVTGPVSDLQREVLAKVHNTYNMNQHTKSGSDQGRVLTPEFIDTYAAVGTVDRVVDKLRQISELGIDKIIVSGPSSGSDRTEAAESHRLMVEQVLPQIKG